MWIWSLCSPKRNHWGGSCGRWEGWDRGRPLRLPRQLKEVSSRDCIEHKSFCFCFCFQKSLNSEFEGLSKLVCVDVVVALVFKATEVRQWALLCNILFNSRFLFFESNNYFASALCTDVVCEEKKGEWEGIGNSIFGIGVNKEYAAACIKQQCDKKHCKNYETCPTQVSWKVKFKYQSCFPTVMPR